MPGSMPRSRRREAPVTSPRLRGEVGAQRRVRGTIRALNIFRNCRSSPSPQPSPRKRGAREQIQFRLLAARCARVMPTKPSPPENQRARVMPDARCIRGLACKRRRKRTRAYRAAEAFPTFPAQWLYGLSRALPGESGLLVTVAPRIWRSQKPGWAGTPPQDLTPASRRQDHTILPYAALVFADSFIGPCASPRKL